MPTLTRDVEVAASADPSSKDEEPTANEAEAVQVKILVGAAEAAKLAQKDEGAKHIPPPSSHIEAAASPTITAPKQKKHSYVGVTSLAFHTGNQKYVARAHIPSHMRKADRDQLYIGWFALEVDAALAHDEAARLLNLRSSSSICVPSEVNFATIKDYEEAKRVAGVGMNDGMSSAAIKSKVVDVITKSCYKECVRDEDPATGSSDEAACQFTEELAKRRAREQSAASLTKSIPPPSSHVEAAASPTTSEKNGDASKKYDEDVSDALQLRGSIHKEEELADRMSDDIGLGSGHIVTKPARRLCSADGCTNVARGEGDVCDRHGAKPKCSHEGCNNQVVNGGACIRHGAEVIKCTHETAPEGGDTKKAPMSADDATINIETKDGTSSEDNNYDGPEPKRASYLDVWHAGELITQKKVQLVVAPPSPSPFKQPQSSADAAMSIGSGPVTKRVRPICSADGCANQARRSGGVCIRHSETSKHDDSSDVAKPWTCCGEQMGAQRKRCGKCHRWKGGAMGPRAGGPSERELVATLAIARQAREQSAASLTKSIPPPQKSNKCPHPTMPKEHANDGRPPAQTGSTTSVAECTNYVKRDARKPSFEQGVRVTNCSTFSQKGSTINQPSNLLLAGRWLRERSEGQLAEERPQFAEATKRSNLREAQDIRGRSTQKEDRRLCSADGCTNVARGKEAVCYSHAGKDNCSHEGCNNQVVNGGACIRHGEATYTSFTRQLEAVFHSKLAFPLSLTHMLESVEGMGLAHIVHWGEDEKSFKICDIDLFVSDVLPKFFKASENTKIRSFYRKLNRWGFSLLRKNVINSNNTWHHPDFNRTSAVKALKQSLETGKPIDLFKKSKKRSHFPGEDDYDNSTLPSIGSRDPSEQDLFLRWGFRCEASDPRRGSSVGGCTNTAVNLEKRVAEVLPFYEGCTTIAGQELAIIPNGTLQQSKCVAREEELGGRVLQPLPNSNDEKEELVSRVEQLEYQLAKEKLQKRVIELEGELSERKAKDNLLRDLKDELAKRNAREVLIQELQDELSRRHAIEEEAMTEREKVAKTAKEELHMHYLQSRFASETNKAAPLTVPPMMPHPLVQGGLPGYAPDAPRPLKLANNGNMFPPNIEKAALLSKNLIQQAAMMDMQQAAMNVDPRHAPQIVQQTLMLSNDVEPNGVDMASSKRPLSYLSGGESSECSGGNLQGLADMNPLATPSKRAKNKYKLTFAQKLMHILSFKECQNAIRWMPNGCAFCIVDSQELVDTVLPKFFKEAKYSSFTRKLRRWGFKHFTLPALEPSGDKEMSIYTHQQFLRDNPALCEMMDGGHRSYMQQRAAQNVDPVRHAYHLWNARHAPQIIQQTLMLSNDVDPRRVDMPSSKRPLSDLSGGESSECSLIKKPKHNMPEATPQQKSVPKANPKQQDAIPDSSLHVASI